MAMAGCETLAVEASSALATCLVGCCDTLIAGEGCDELTLGTACCTLTVVLLGRVALTATNGCCALTATLGCVLTTTLGRDTLETLVVVVKGFSEKSPFLASTDGAIFSLAVAVDEVVFDSVFVAVPVCRC